jgi:predicted transcriptional regulator
LFVSFSSIVIVNDFQSVYICYSQCFPDNRVPVFVVDAYPGERQMSEKRSKLQIFMDILNLIQKESGKAKPTRILYGANLSHSALKEYLNYLTSNGFIQEMKEDGHVFYALTEKGYGFINEFRRMKRLTEAFGLPM